jgi:hypothetical protein
MSEQDPTDLAHKEVSAFYLTGAESRAFFSVEEGGQTHVFQLSAPQVRQLGLICLHVAHRLEQGKTAP